MRRTSLIPRTVQPGEIVSLTERLGRLQALRLAMVAAVAAAALFAVDFAREVDQMLVLTSAAYLVAAGATELLRRRSRRLSLGTLSVMLLVDGAYLAWAAYLTGGTQSPLRFVLFVHLVAVTLLASYRTGLKIALWHSLLSVVVLYAQAAELVPARESAPGVVPTAESGLASLPVFNVTAFWAVAVVTAAFSSLNERELRRRRADADALATMATEMERLDRGNEIAERLLCSLADQFGFRRGVVLGARDGAAVLAHRGAVDPAPPLDGLDAVVQDARDRRGPVLARRLDPSRDPLLAALLPDARRLLVVPLLADDGLVGAVAVEAPAARGRSIERRLVTLVAQFSAYAALALRNAWLLERIRRLAETDGLTGVANRRAFDAALAREVARSHRQGMPVGLLLLDVDHFKSFNDDYGHTAGDAVLVGLAEMLATESRGFDIVARYGGEEFAVVLPGCDIDEAFGIAERMRRQAGAVRAPAPITISVGAATLPGDAATAETLIDAADRALYASKRGGRDRVTLASTEAR